MVYQLVHRVVAQASSALFHEHHELHSLPRQSCCNSSQFLAVSNAFVGNRSSRITTTSRRCLATEAPSEHVPSKDANINKIVEDISQLTLLQAADLVATLKSRLNIQEIAMPAAAPAAASSAAPADEPAAEQPAEKTIFNVKLESFDAASKPKVIREVKAMIPNLTLIDAKKLVESLPQTLKENIPKEDAEKLQKAFEALGAVVKLE
ncbi:60s ribosomal protein l7 l12 [Moniliophthora roreri MCA 2997]|uniref:60s ribosomal protein l7 l12 n=1 Tax=Moniliophthora roreri (strain MCA 2997) TaxID=1381753 RepID=V2YPX8_MONRO|nr:60s ribosomal protein l7 l12 [Moniliophthora roreri MCA 2997]